MQWAKEGTFFEAILDYQGKEMPDHQYRSRIREFVEGLSVTVASMCHVNKVFILSAIRQGRVPLHLH